MEQHTLFQVTVHLTLAELCPFEIFGNFWFPTTGNSTPGALNCTGVSICAASYYFFVVFVIFVTPALAWAT